MGSEAEEGDGKETEKSVGEAMGKGGEWGGKKEKRDKKSKWVRKQSGNESKKKYE